MDFVRKRTENVLRLLERRERASAKAFVVSLQLFEDVEARALLSLLFEHLVLLFAGNVEFIMNLSEPFLAFLDRAALGLSVQFLSFDVDRKFMQTRLEAGSLLFELNFFGGKFFE